MLLPILGSMLSEPTTLPRAALIDALYVAWSISVDSIEYAAIGAGSHHWSVTDVEGQRWFVSADEAKTAETADTLRRAYDTASSLRAAGLDFVLAPLPNAGGSTVTPVSGWQVTVRRYIEGHGGTWGEWADEARHLAAAAIIGRLHQASPPAELPLWQFDVPLRTELVDALDHLDEPWASGPYAERCRNQLRTSTDLLSDLFERYDELAHLLRASSEPWVVSHGEPHPGNFVTSTSGDLYLIDWDTVRLAPRERDVWLLCGENEAAMRAYLDNANQPELRPEVLELFRLRWRLQDICVNVAWLRAPHDDSDDSRLALQYLSESITEP